MATAFPHGSTIDSEGNLWVTDARGAEGKGHQVFKFNADGKVVMTLGKAGVSGSGPDLFDQPTDVVVAPNGDIFVADSHRNGKNNRIVKFTKDGKFRPPDLIDFSMTPNRRLSAVRCQETEFRWC